MFGEPEGPGEEIKTALDQIGQHTPEAHLAALIQRDGGSVRRFLKRAAAGDFDQGSVN